MKYYAGIDIGGTRIKMGIINELGEVIVNENEETKKAVESGEDIFQLLFLLLEIEMRKQVC